MGVVCLFLAKFSSCVLLEVSIIVKEFLQYFTEIWGGSDRNNEMKFGPEKTKLWDRAMHPPYSDQVSCSIFPFVPN